MITKLGMPADEVAECVLKGLRDETFYMLSHRHVVDLARERWNEVEAAFEAQAPRREGDTSYAMPNVMARPAAPASENRTASWWIRPMTPSHSHILPRLHECKPATAC